jgi:hypothetical protein
VEVLCGQHHLLAAPRYGWERLKAGALALGQPPLGDAVAALGVERAEG